MRLAVPFFIRQPATPDLYPLSLHDALPISRSRSHCQSGIVSPPRRVAYSSSERSPRNWDPGGNAWSASARSEEHTSELQSLRHLVCRLLLEKKNPPRCSDRSKYAMAI